METRNHPTAHDTPDPDYDRERAIADRLDEVSETEAVRLSRAETGPIKRTPSGAAVPGAHPRPKKYPHQLIVMVDEATWQRIESDAERGRLSKSEVGRTYLEAGIAYADELAAKVNAEASR
jgi:hypothetical protein